MALPLSDTQSGQPCKRGAAEVLGAVSDAQDLQASASPPVSLS
jgi:hypothetical protein